MNCLKKTYKLAQKNIFSDHLDAVEKSYIKWFNLSFKEPEMLNGFIVFRRKSMIYWTFWVFFCAFLHHIWQTFVEF